MATILSHSVVALTCGYVVAGRCATWKFWVASILCSILPDVDVAAFWFDIPYEGFWGHRGFTHSLAFAAIVGYLAANCFAKEIDPPMSRKPWLFTYFFALTASHGVLDAMTDGGLGIAFFTPFDTTRYFLPWRPIPVSPIGTDFFSRWGAEVLLAEIFRIWLICLVIFAGSYIFFQRKPRVGR
jgi:inner membrane protein